MFLETSVAPVEPRVGRQWWIRYLALAAIGVLPGISWAALVINEFLPDPEGSDAGREFVELLNAGLVTEPLAGVSLQFANGAEGAVWTTRWTGAEDFRLEPGHRFLVVDRNWSGEAVGQAEVYLGLQNGPDAVRLIRGEVVLDLVGYGPLTDRAMMEGEPAAVASGRSVSRRPDGQDTQNNGFDFVLSVPTPGNPNFLPFSLAVRSWELDPPTVDRVSSPVRFTLGILNNGTESFPVGEIILRVAGRDHGSLLDHLPPDQERVITWIIKPSLPGLWPLEVMVPLAAGADTLVLHPASLQVGPGRLILNEVLAAPLRGQGEWVELTVVGDQAVDLAGHSLRDEDGPWRPLPGMILPAGEFLVLAQDSLALAGWHLDNQAQGAVTACAPELAVVRQRELAAWPTLNNTPAGDRDYADRVYLAGPSFHVIDHLTFGGAGSLMGGDSDPGQSLERFAPGPRNPGASNWAPCTAVTGSTPGCSNSVARAGAMSTGFTIQPRLLDSTAGVSNVHFLFTLSGAQIGWEVQVYDLWGGLVRDLGGDNLGTGPRDLLWDGRDDQGRLAGPGGYIVLFESRDRYSRCLGREKVLMVIR